MDAYTDTSHRPLAFLQAKGVTLPDFAKEAFSPTPEKKAEVAVLHKSAFADGKSAYPVHSPGDTLASLAHAVFYGADGKVLDNIVKSAHAFEVNAEADAILAALEASVVVETKVASAPVKTGPVYALPEKQAYLIDSPARLHDVARRLEEDKHQIPWVDFVDAAKGLTKRASQLHRLSSVPPGIQVYAEDYVPDYAATKTAALQRAGLCANEEIKSLYRELADAVTTKEASEARDVMVLLSDIDQAAGLTLRKLAAAGLPDPFKAVFSTVPVSLLEKRASLCFVIEGKKVPTAAMQAIPSSCYTSFRKNASSFLEKVAALGGAGVTDDLRKELAELPATAQRHILDLAIAYGPDTV